MKMTKSSSPGAGPHIAESRAAAESLKALLKSGIWKDHSDLLEITPAAAVASLLLGVVSCVEEISGAVRELESQARFKSDKPRVPKIRSREILMAVTMLSMIMLSTLMVYMSNVGTEIRLNQRKF